MLKKINKAICILICIVIVILAIKYLPNKYKEIIYPMKYEQEVVKFAKENDIDPYLIYAIIKTESGFKPKVESNVGARGLMQLMEDAYEWVKYKKDDTREITFDDMYEPEYNIEYGTYLISILYKEYNELPTALAAYHAGRGQVSKWISDSAYSDDGKKLNNIPSVTTKHYVEKVMKAYEGYTNLYNK